MEVKSSSKPVAGNVNSIACELRINRLFLRTLGTTYYMAKSTETDTVKHAYHVRKKDSVGPRVMHRSFEQTPAYLENK